MSLSHCGPLRFRIEDIGIIAPSSSGFPFPAFRIPSRVVGPILVAGRPTRLDWIGGASGQTETGSNHESTDGGLHEVHRVVLARRGCRGRTCPVPRLVLGTSRVRPCTFARMLQVWLRKVGDAVTAGPLCGEELVASAPAADDLVADHPSGPFVPLQPELDRNGPLREALLHACPMARATRYARLRWLLFAGLVPVLLLLEIDRELMLEGRPGAGAALALDALFALAIAFDLAWVTPRHPHATAAAFGSVALRICALAMATCGREAHWVVWAFAGAASAGSAAVLALSPTPRQVADHLRKSLAMAPPTKLPLRTSRGFYPYIAYAIAAAAALPGLLFLLQFTRTPLIVQLLAFFGFAWLVPQIGRVVFGGESPPWRDALRTAAGTMGRSDSLRRGGLKRAAIRTWVTVGGFVGPIVWFGAGGAACSGDLRGLRALLVPERPGSR